VEAARPPAPLPTRSYYEDLDLPITSGTFVDTPTFFTHYSAFADIGTFALLFKLLGGQCVGGCEIDEPTAQIFAKECPLAVVGQDFRTLDIASLPLLAKPSLVLLAKPSRSPAARLARSAEALSYPSSSSTCGIISRTVRYSSRSRISCFCKKANCLGSSPQP
jgi:hypothetical protein